MKKLEVLISTINRNEFDFIKKINLKCDAIVINQNSTLEDREIQFDGYKVKIYNDFGKGLSRSRNLAITYSTADYCVLCDDDVIYDDNYSKKILSAFNKLPDADIIVFNTDSINNKRKKEYRIKKIKNSPKNKYYGSVRIAFKRKSIIKNNIWFNLLFGAGAKYSAGEESLFLKEARTKKLKIYEYPETIATVDYSDSTWFDGYNKDFFINKGAWIGYTYPYLKNIVILYSILRCKNLTNLSALEIYSYLKEGIIEINSKNEKRGI